MIDRFDGPYRFLSNFYSSLVEFEGINYPSVEHAFVAAKTEDIREREHIAGIGTAREVKAYGRKLKLRPGWNDMRLQVMEDLVRQKFTRHPLLMKGLMDTDDRVLVEGNYWGDAFWGVDLKTNAGLNHLGKILMKVREELKA